MKKLLGITALILAFTPFAQAQNSDSGVPGHPDARNDRKMESSNGGAMVHHAPAGAKHMRGTKHHVMKHHVMKHHAAKHHAEKNESYDAPAK